MSDQKVALIIGSGPNIGQSTSRAFAARGYKVALASRSAKTEENTADLQYFEIDLTNPSSVPELFTKVKEALGIPSVVIYNAAAATPNEPDNTFSVSLSDFENNLNINTVSPYAAAQQAVLAFAELPESASRTFIYTGNMLNTGIVIPPLMTLGVGKNATSHLIQHAAMTLADRGFKFYYVDERLADGSPMYTGLGGDAHATHFVMLSEGDKQGEWLQTFVKGQGYTKF